jgi:ABC-type nitrate/sulfonate/bicarbonate transport system permease component
MASVLRAGSSRHQAARLALLDAFTAGAGLGYLAHRYREVLVANPATIGLVLLFTFALALLIAAAVRGLRRAASRVDAIFAEELRKPSPRPR